jgi:amino acid transporter
MPSSHPPRPNPPRPWGPFQLVERGHLVATRSASVPQRGVAKAAHAVKQRLIGAALPTSELAHDRIPRWKALAVFASDALSSVAYASEEVLLVLMAAGAAALTWSVPIALAIVALLAVVAYSYRQTILKYPEGGGTYLVTKDNLGTAPALVAGASLMVDYVLTVAVSISSGAAAVTSAMPSLAPYTVAVALGAIALVTLANLRGIRESASIMAVPTYVFVFSMAALLAVGAWRALHGLGPVEAVASVAPGATEQLTLFLVLRAFASGCSAMTGTEAIADGVPAFKAPQAANAVSTLWWMAGILGTLFLGITLLSTHFGILPTEGETVLSQLTRACVGHGWFYYAVQAATALVLVLAANTAFADFPRLASFLAKDRFMPRQFVFRGDRLGFSVGIIALGVVAGALVLAFHASVSHLIPLYAVGVFISFTLSQTSMARRWWTRRESGWARGLVINGVGATVTGVVAAVIMATKFTAGAWMVIVMLPLMVAVLVAIARHYESVAAQLAPEAPEVMPYALTASRVLVPIADLNRASLRTLRYAMGLSKDVTALHVALTPESATALRAQWAAHGLKAELVVVESPYRALVQPVLAYLEQLAPESHAAPVTVVLSELVPRHAWQFLLHNRLAFRLKLALLFRPNVSVIDVPFHLG